MHFSPAIWITIICDVVSLSIAVSLLVLNKKHYGRQDNMSVFFNALLYLIVAMSVMEAVVYVGNFRIAPGTPVSNLIISLLHEVLITVFTLVWLFFVVSTLYKNGEYIKRKFWIITMPLLIATGLAVASATFFFFNFNFEDIDKDDMIMGWVTIINIGVLLVVRLFYFIRSFQRIRQYQKESGSLVFFKIWYLFVPIIVGSFITNLLECSFRVLGFAVGIALLYLSILAEKRYIDPDSGFYNDRYIDFLAVLAQKGKKDFGSRTTFKFESAAALEDFREDFKKLIPKDCEIIRSAADKIVVLAKVSDRALSHMIMEDVRYAAEEKGFSVDASFMQKQADETTEEFLGKIK